MGGEKRVIRPVFFRFGVVVALSLGGAFYSILRKNHIKKLKHSQSGAKSDRNAQPTLEKHEVPNNSVISAISPSCKCGGENENILLPELKELLGELDVVTTRKLADRDAYEREINNLNNLVRVLSERERNLEIQLLEYYGLKEQEAVVMELKNRLKLNNMEAKIFSLKIESLQADNKRLEEKVSAYAEVVTELEAARAKIKVLKKKLKSETEQNKELILNLRKRVQLLQDKEGDHEATKKLQKVKTLEEEVEELRKRNEGLQIKNSECAQKLDYTRLLAKSVLEDQELETLKKEFGNLQNRNKDLTSQIGQLQADRSADVEELVYLRWINACLRHELRNYQSAPGKTSARDLSRTLSPKSEAKAKHLIMEYTNKDTESDHCNWSSTRSHTTDSTDFDDSSIANSSSNKARFMSKLRRLVTGKDKPYRHRRSSSMENLSNASTPRGIYVNSSQGSSRSSVDLGRLRSVKSVDTKGSSSGGDSSVGSSSKENQTSESINGNATSDSSLVKYAKVSKGSKDKNPNSHGSYVSYHSF